MTESKDPLTVAVELERIADPSVSKMYQPERQTLYDAAQLLRSLTAPRAAADTERGAFEQWWSKGGFEKYKESMWAAWEARAALSQPAKEQEPIPVAEVAAGKYGNRLMWHTDDAQAITPVGTLLFAAPVQQEAKPEHNPREVKRHSDFSVLVIFNSCREASVFESALQSPQAEAQSKECQHKNGTAHWDYYGCNDCGWIMPGGQFRGGLHHGWFPSMDAVREFDKFKTYPGMNEVKPISRWSKSDKQDGK